MPSLVTLASDQRETFATFLAARPFSDRERDYWQLCWLPVSQAQADAINVVLPPNTVCEPKQLGAQLYINADYLSDAASIGESGPVASGRLAAIFDTISGLEFQYINPWEWEADELEAWQSYDGTADTIYQIGDMVSHDSKQWVSTTPNNVWEPGVFGWREQTDDGTPPLWRQPLGAGDAWQADDEVLHNDKQWKSLVADNVWEPGTDATLWQDVTATEPPDDGPAEWAVGVSYTVGDQVTYLGITYTCRQSHTSIAGWTPLAVLALWLPA